MSHNTDMAVALLRAFSLMYDNGLMTEKEMSMASILFNGLGFFTAMHEIAQLNVAKHLYDNFYMTELERKIEDASQKSWWGGCKTYEADVVANTAYIWEIKSIGSSVSEANKQLDNYVNLTGFLRVFDINLQGIELFGRYRMNVNSVPGSPGVLQYSFTKQPKKGQSQEQEAPVTISQVRDAYNKVYAVAMAPFLAVMGATIIEDVVTLGTGIADDVISLVAALQASITAVELLSPIL